HDIALALVTLAAHLRAGGARHLHGAVARIVVVDVDRSLRERGAEIGDHLADGGLLVEARNEHREPGGCARTLVEWAICGGNPFPWCGRRWIKHVLETSDHPPETARDIAPPAVYFAAPAAP